MAAAGTLEIQLIADVARLQKDMRDMQRAVDSATGDMATGFDKTGRAAKAANDNIGNLALEADKLRSKIDPMYAAQKRFNQEMDAADILLKKGVISTREHSAAVDMARKTLNDHAVSVMGNTKELKQMNPQVTLAGDTAKLSRHHVMNLGYQFQDLFVSLASGQKPTTVFIQQGSQIASVMADAGVGVGGVVKQLGSMLVGLVRAHPVITAVVVAGTALFTAIENLTGELSKTAKIDEYAKSLGLTDKEMKKLGPTSITTMDAIKGIWRTIDEGLGLSDVFNTVGKWFSDLFSKALQWAKDAAINIYGALAASFDSIVYIWKNFPRIIGDMVVSAANMAIDGIQNMINRAVSAINGLASKANAVLKLVNLPAIPEIDDVQIARIANSYAGAATSVADVYSSSFAKRTQQAVDTLRAVGDTFSNNIIAAAKDRLDASAKDIISNRAEKDTREKAGKAGKDAGDEFSRELLKSTNEALSTLFKTFGGLDVYQRIGINVQGDYDLIFKKINDNRDKAIKDQAEAHAENLRLATEGAKTIGDIIGGSIGAGIKDLMSVLKQEFPTFAASLGKAFGGLKDMLDGVLAKMGTSIASLGAGAAVGSGAAALAGGSSLGGAVGGAIGQGVGSSIAALGAFGGPIGAIAGGLLGGIIGGLFKKTKSASATIENIAGKLDVAGVVGNDAKFKQTANTLAGAVIGGINQAADLIGAEVSGAIRMSIGQRKDWFVVDTLGLGRTKGSGTVGFKSEAEAIAYAIDNAIRSGVLGGIRKGTETLLKGFGDLEDRLQKAADFEGVFRALAADVDPFKVAMDTLEARFQALIATFREAGATTEEWADLERYYQQEREKAIREGNAKALEAVNAARDQLTQAYERESAAIMTTLERFQSLTSNLESFRLSLAEQLMTAEEIYKAAKANFDEVARLAAEGNEKAISDLVSVSQKYLDASKNFLTPEDYNREIQNVMKAVDVAIAQTKTMEDYAQLQLDALNNSVDGLLTVNESVLSVRDAIATLQDALGKVQTAPPTTLVFSAPAMPTDMPPFGTPEFYQWLINNGYTGALPQYADGGMHGGGLRIVGENGPELEATGASRIYNAEQTAAIMSGGAGVAQEVAALRSEMKLAMYQIAKNTGKTTDQLQRWDGDGMPEVRAVA